MVCSIEILNAGLLSTIQDQGRIGNRYFAIPKNGVLDLEAYRKANLLVGNPEHEAVIECNYTAAHLRFSCNAVIALTGADMEWEINRIPASIKQSHRLLGGDVLSGRIARHGVRGYIAIGGNWKIDKVLGSKSTNLVSGFGGHHGRALEKGDRLIIDSYESESPIIGIEENNDYDSISSIHINMGPEWEMLGHKMQQLLLSTEFKISSNNNRVGARLEGATLELSENLQASNVVFPGVIQWPIGGSPIVLLNDCQTTGGYPRAGIIDEEELWRFAQIRIGKKFRFVMK